MQAHETLDARGLSCPLPILRTRKALARLEPGQVLEVRATDPGSVKDMEAFCRQAGHELVASSEEGGTYVFLLRRV